jgi:hypothetical protein
MHDRVRVASRTVAVLIVGNFRGTEQWFLAAGATAVK